MFVKVSFITSCYLRASFKGNMLIYPMNVFTSKATRLFFTTMKTRNKYVQTFESKIVKINEKSTKEKEMEYEKRRKELIRNICGRKKV